MGPLESWALSLDTPSWDWSGLTYRIDPASRPKNMVLWRKVEDVPTERCLMKGVTRSEDWSTLISVCPDGVIVMAKLIAVAAYAAYLIKWQELHSWSYSTDGKVWWPCEVEVAE